MISASATAWAVVDLTLHPASKKATMDSYAAIDPASLANYGLVCPNKRPELIVVRMTDADDGGYPQILVGDRLHSNHAELIADPLLREALASAEGSDLTHIPEIPIAFVPESRGPELREGLVDLVMELFRPERPARTAAEITDAGLERLATCISNEAKRDLISQVEKELKSLIRDSEAPLADDLDFTDGRFHAKEGVTWHPKTLERMRRALGSWVKAAPRGRLAKLNEYSSSSP